MSLPYIQLKPFISVKSSCPSCGEKLVEPHSLAIFGYFEFVSASCPSCAENFYVNLPTGHFSDNISYFSVKDLTPFKHASLDTRFSKRYYQALAYDDQPINLKITRQGSVGRKVVLINCIDFLYGHSLLKMFNSSELASHHPELVQIFIIPKGFKWLVPSYAGEIWEFSIKNSNSLKWYTSIRNQISKQLERFDEVYISKGYSHPKLENVHIEDYTKVTPFNIDDTESFRRQPVVTFISREDRLWYRNKFHRYLFAICKRLKQRNIIQRNVAVLIQNKLFIQTAKEIIKEFPGAQFQVTGLGKTGTFPSWIFDERQVQLDAEKEINWCRIYAKSHLVIGFHGSNMILPSAHSAGVIEIISEDRLGNWVQDIFVRYYDRKQLFFYRFLPQFSSAKIVGKYATSILRGFKRFNENMITHKHFTQKINQKISK